MKGTMKTVLMLAILGVILYFTNPSMQDFGSYYERRQVAASQKGVSDGLKKFSRALAQSKADLVVKVGFKRHDKLFLSYFTLGPASKPSQQYLGMAKFIFIKVR